MQSKASDTVDRLLGNAHTCQYESLDRESSSSPETSFIAISQSGLSSLSTRPLPALPVEVIQKILKYTFLPNTPLTPSSDPYHLRGTTHVLLVSRGIRELALPSFYHTVNITRPSDYVTFFDPEHGLFTAKVDDGKRWSLVREFGIVAGVTPPVGTHPIWEDEDIVDAIADLEVVDSDKLQRFCLLKDKALAVRDLAPVEGASGALKALQGDAEYRGYVSFCLSEAIAEGDDPDAITDPTNGSVLESAIDDTIKQELKFNVRCQSAEYLYDLLTHNPPSEVWWSAKDLHRSSLMDIRQRERLDRRPGRLQDTKLVITGSSDTQGPSDPDDDDEFVVDAAWEICNTVEVFGVLRVHLEDSSQDHLDRVVAAFSTRNSAENRCVTWSRTLEDGSVYEHAPADLDAKI